MVYAFITKNQDNYELQFSSFIDNFSQFKHIGEYNKETKKLIIPASEYDNMLKLLNENQYFYWLFYSSKAISNTL